MLKKLLDDFSEICLEYYCYGDVDFKTIEGLLQSNDIELVADEMAASVCTSDGGEAPYVLYEIAKDIVDDYLYKQKQVGG